MAALAALMLAGLLVAPAGAATVSGTVFQDFNTNGLRDTDADTGAVDGPVAGLTVRAFTGSTTVVDTTTTAADGTYTLTAPNARVRVELSAPRPWWSTRQLNGLRSHEQFIDASRAVRGADFGVHYAASWSVDDPPVAYAMQWPGPVTDTNSRQSAIRQIDYFTTPLNRGSFNSEPSRQIRATFGDVGTVYGLGVDQSSGTLYAGAYYKRFAGLTSAGTGAIFRVGPLGTITLWADLNAGADGHPGSNVNDWFGTAPANRDMSWNLVGKAALGSVRVDPQDQNVYAVNLADNTLNRLPLDATPPVRPADSTAVPDPGCVGGAWHAFSIGFDRGATNDMYVGGVCNAETSQSTADLRAVVYRVSNPDTNPSFSPVLSIPLTYPRVPSPPQASPFQLASSDWQPWPTAASINGRGFLSPADVGRGTRPSPGGPVNLNDESYPQLTGISVDQDGSMQLGFRDLMGDMSGNSVTGEGNTDPPGSTLGASVTIQGDLLRAAPTGSGFTLESGGRSGGLTGFGSKPLGGGGGYGPIGPGGGYFYDPNPGIGFSIPSNEQGGVMQVPGFRDVMTTQNDVLRATSNGFLWYDNSDGAKSRGFHNFDSSPYSPTGGWQKANGLGDLDSYMGRAPVQIGNRLWYDVDRNGLQDADEDPVTDTVVELLDENGVVIDNTTTDSRGEYIFAVAPDTRYTVRVPLAQPSLDGWVVTQAFAGRDRRIDDNGVERGGWSVASVSAHGVGHNDHTYDFGFNRPLPPRPPEPRPPAPPEPPQPPVDQPTPPSQPAYAGAEPSPNTPMVLVKYLVRRTRSGEQLRKLQFGMVVRNAGPGSVSQVRLCDNLPRVLNVLGATRLARRFPRARQVCWRLASLTSGQARKFQVLTQLRRRVLIGLLVNRARAVAQRVKPAHARAVVRGRRPAPRVTG